MYDVYSLYYIMIRIIRYPDILSKR